MEDSRVSDDLYQDYNAAIGAVMAARHQYEVVCSEHGTESPAAEQAYRVLHESIAQREEVRERYDRAPRVAR
jgi:uncharacterized protein YqeY